MEEHEDGTQTGAIYDIEPENGKYKKESLPGRVRFYHAKIDVNVFDSGEEYSNLKQVYVIFITPFDPFDRKRMVYTIKNGCVEEPDMPKDIKMDKEVNLMYLKIKEQEEEIRKEVQKEKDAVIRKIEEELKEAERGKQESEREKRELEEELRRLKEKYGEVK